jgi:HAD superfamily hydrolase (TIGR01490 family)
MSNAARKKSNAIAFFDLDHTIIDTNSGKVLILRLLRAPEISWGILLKLAVFSLFYKLRIISEENMFLKSNMLVRGFKVTRFSSIAGKVAEDILFPKIRPEIRSAIEQHRANGDTTVIISASLRPLCEPIREHLGIDHLICTELAVKDGHLTGEPSGGRLCYGKGKVAPAEKFCAQNACSFDNAWYYADSISDIYLLEKVSHPVCVSPDKKLRIAAAEHGWTIW